MERRVLEYSRTQLTLIIISPAKSVELDFFEKSYKQVLTLSSFKPPSPQKNRFPRKRENTPLSAPRISNTDPFFVEGRREKVKHPVYCLLSQSWQRHESFDGHAAYRVDYAGGTTLIESLLQSSNLFLNNNNYFFCSLCF